MDSSVKIFCIELEDAPALAEDYRSLNRWAVTADGPNLLLVSRLLFACAMVTLFVIDLQHRILPNVITLPGIVIGFGFSLVQSPGWSESLIGILVGGGVLFSTAIPSAYP